MFEKSCFNFSMPWYNIRGDRRKEGENRTEKEKKNKGKKE